MAGMQCLLFQTLHLTTSGLPHLQLFSRNPINFSSFLASSILHSCHAGISAPFASLLTQIVPFHAMLLCVCKGCWMTTSAAVPRFVNPHFLLNTKVQISPNYHRFVWIKGLHSCEFQKAEEWIPGKQKHQ